LLHQVIGWSRSPSKRTHNAFYSFQSIQQPFSTLLDCSLEHEGPEDLIIIPAISRHAVR
jgi:hypothetical protein